MTLFYVFYDAQAQRGKGYPSSLVLLLFEIIWNYEYQNNEFDNPEQKPHSIIFNQIIISFRPQPNLENSRRFKCPHILGPRSDIVNCFRKLVTIS